ncbi:MAG: class I tRNA ligase family protein [Kouleothrix sp.]
MARRAHRTTSQPPSHTSTRSHTSATRSRTVRADALARYGHLCGRDVWFLTGTDENSLKNVRAAEREGIPTQELAGRNAAQFYALRDSLGLSFDDFIRTSAPMLGTARGTQALVSLRAQRRYLSARRHAGCTASAASSSMPRPS